MNNDFDAKRIKVFKFLDDQRLLSVLNDFDNMPEEILGPLQESSPNYPTYEQFKQNICNKNFDSFDDFIQNVFEYLRVIPDLFPPENQYEEDQAEATSQNKLPMHIIAYKAAIEEVLLNLDRYVALLKTDINVLKARYFRFITGQVDKLIAFRPNTSETDAISKPRTKVFSSHSIPTKINPP